MQIVNASAAAVVCVCKAVMCYHHQGSIEDAILGGEDVCGRKRESQGIWGHASQKNLGFRPI